MSSKDFRLAFIVIKKFKISQGSLKNTAHQVSELWKAAMTPEGYDVLKVDFGGIENSKMKHCELNSIDIWPRYGGKTASGILFFRISVNANNHFASCRRPCVSQNTVSDANFESPFSFPTKGQAL